MLTSWMFSIATPLSVLLPTMPFLGDDPTQRWKSVGIQWKLRRPDDEDVAERLMKASFETAYYTNRNFKELLIR